MTDYETVIGFCSKCNIIREDAIKDGKRIPITDCPCTAVVYGHTEECGYTKFCGSPFALDGCETHGYFPCEKCDCTCGKVTV